jgi:hypothetical protein
MAADALSRKPDEPPEVADSLFLIKPIVETLFERLRGLEENHPEELQRKGFLFKNGQLYQINPRGVKVRIITDVNKTSRFAKETHI